MAVLILLVQRGFRMHMAESNALAVKHISSTVHAIIQWETIVEVMVSPMEMAQALMTSLQSNAIQVVFIGPRSDHSLRMSVTH